MKSFNTKYNLRVITAAHYHSDPKRYELRSGLRSDAPPCPYGHRFKWIGYDLVSAEYVRVTKSVFKRLIKLLDRAFVLENEEEFNKH